MSLVWYEGKTGGQEPIARSDVARRLWRRPDFAKLWAADLVSQFGTQVTGLAVPLVAVITLRATPVEVGALRTVEFLPFLVLSLVVGAWVDRQRRRPILIGSDVGHALVLLALPVAFVLGHLALWLLYLVLFLVGILDVCAEIAAPAYLPTLIARDQLVAGNTALQTSRSAAQVAGPGLAGALVAAVSAPLAIVGDILSYLASGLLLALIRRPEPPPAPSAPVGSRASWRAEIGAGLRYVWGHPMLRALALCSAALNVGFAILNGLLVLYMVRTLGLAAGAIGLVFSLGNLSLLAGAALAGPLAARAGLGRTLLGAVALLAVGFALVPLAPRALPLPALIAGQLLQSFGIVVYNINQASLRQAVTPAAMQGRAAATTRFISWSTLALGPLAGGLLATGVGPRATLGVGALAGLSALIPLALSPLRTLHTLTHAEE